MAYRRAQRTTRRTSRARSSYSPRRSYRAAPKKTARRARPAAKRRASAPQRTIRIVIEQPQTTTVSRPDQLVQKIEQPKKAKF
jgi:hypothetical protein